MEILLIEGANEFFELLFNRLHIDLLPIVLLGVRIEIVGEKNANVIETFHFDN